jgi:hypothetical protein
MELGVIGRYLPLISERALSVKSTGSPRDSVVRRLMYAGWATS